MIEVCGHRILVKPILLEESDDTYRSAKAAGIILARDNTKRERESVDRGVVLQIGPTAWQTDSLGGKPWAEVGDTVVYAKFAGKLVQDPETKEELICINDEDVCAIVSTTK